MVGTKMQEFWPRINMIKGNYFKTILRWIMVCQKVPKLNFQSQFSKSKSNNFAQESTCSKDFFFKQSCDELWFVKKCQNCTFKVNSDNFPSLCNLIKCMCVLVLKTQRKSSTTINLRTYLPYFRGVFAPDNNN